MSILRPAGGIIFLTLLASCGGEAASGTASAPAKELQAIAGPRTGHYDVAADPQAQLAAAVADATRQNKRILLVVGGEWCSWCHILDNYVKANPDIEQAWHAGYVTAFINFSDENTNEAFLSKYPKIDGYPHIFVLDTSGALLHSQNTALLEEGRGYSKAKMQEFLAKWRKA